ncbi:MAG: dipeptidase, partial [Bacteroidales bacterium]
VDRVASELFYNDKDRALEYITDYSVKTGNSTVSEWKKLYRYLFTKYMDGNIKEKVEGQLNPSLEQPGYDKEWYRMLIRETGEKFKMPGEAHH